MTAERRSSDILFRKTGFFLAGFAGFFFFFFIASLLVDSLDILDTASPLAPEPLFFASTGISSILLLLSALIPSLVWLQPFVLLVTAPLPLLSSSSSMYSLGSFIAAEILLFRLGFFEKGKIAKFAITILYFFLSVVIIGLNKGYPAIQIISPILFMFLYLGFLLLVYGDRWVVYLRESPPEISLSASGLSAMEGKYLKALVGGMSIKEIAAEDKVKESTVRNTLARVYRKFGVPDKAALMAACAGRKIVP